MTGSVKSFKVKDLTFHEASELKPSDRPSVFVFEGFTQSSKHLPDYINIIRSHRRKNLRQRRAVTL